jgi:hypothetical protein
MAVRADVRAVVPTRRATAPMDVLMDALMVVLMAAGCPSRKNCRGSGNVVKGATLTFASE